MVFLLNQANIADVADSASTSIRRTRPCSMKIDKFSRAWLSMAGSLSAARIKRSPRDWSSASVVIPVPQPISKTLKEPGCFTHIRRKPRDEAADTLAHRRRRRTDQIKHLVFGADGAGKQAFRLAG